MKPGLFTLILLLILSCRSGEDNESIIIDVIEDIVVPSQYIVTRSQEKIVIDGRADESGWKSALFTDSFIDIEGVKTPKFNTKIKMIWDDSFLYVYSEMQEPHLWGYLRQRDTIIYYNNDFEIFLNPSGTGKRYGEIEINVLGTVWDLFLDKPYRVGGQAVFHWNLDELKSAVRLQGTLNNSEDTDSLWAVEMAIPLAPLIALKNKPKTFPKEGEQWRVNFSRVEWNHEVINGKYQR